MGSTPEIAVRWLIATLLLGWLATPYAYDQLDDLFITLAYSHHWVETGQLAWTTGERVEGYSNFAWVVLGALGAVGGVDTAAMLKLVAFASASALLGFVSALAPSGPRGHVAVLAFAIWAPLAWWSVVALETTLFALLLAAGWAALCADRRVAAAALLSVAALTRPEGTGYLLLAVAVVGIRPRKPEDAVAAVPVAALALYHVARVAWFGAVLPTPFLVKVQATSAGLVGLQQWSGDLLAGAGLLALALAAFRPGTWLVLVPFVVQSALLVRADGDWMGMSRLVLPGLAATTIASFATGAPRSAPWFAGTAVVALFAGVWEPHWPLGGACRSRDFAALADPIGNLERPWLTPFDEDLRFVVENLPDGTVLETADVGLTGQIPGILVKDTVGLVDREMAELWASGQRDPYVLPRFGPDGDLDCLRIVDYHGAEPWVDERVVARFPAVHDVRYGTIVARYGCRDDRRPPAETVLARWDALIARYPSQPALRVARDAALARASFPEPPYPWHPGRGWGLYDDRTVVSRTWRADDAGRLALHLDADDPFGDGAVALVSTVPACGRPPERHVVRGPTTVPLPPVCAETATYAVQLANDRNEAGRDRNLYAAIAEGPGMP